MKCNRCVNKNTEYCETCIDHPKWANRPKQSNFQLYKPTCPFGYKDCICDPAYILWSDPEWYKELYNALSPEEAAKEEDGSCCLCDSHVIDERTICPCMEYCDDNGRLYGHMDIISCKYHSIKEDRYLIQWIGEGQEYQVLEINADAPFYGSVDTYFHNFKEIAWSDFVINILQDCYGLYTSKTIIGNAFSNPELLKKVEHI